MSIINVSPGAYHDPNQPGWGFSLHSDGASGLVGHLFCHDPFGNRLWCVVNANGILTKTSGAGFPGRYIDRIPANCGIVKLEGNKDGTVSMRLTLTAESVDGSSGFSPPLTWPYVHTATLVKLV